MRIGDGNRPASVGASGSQVAGNGAQSVPAQAISDPRPAPRFVSEPRTTSGARRVTLPTATLPADSYAIPAQLFREMAPLYRASKEEGAIRDYARSLARTANIELWAGKLEIRGPDRAGNIAIKVPGTGRFAKADRPVVALQAHMDMVLAADAVPPGGDLKAYFKANPVKLTEVDGVLRSTEPRTSIGADDAIGVGLALRYVMDPRIEHPPLDILLTTSEEQGLTGARELEHEAMGFAPDVLVSLDALDKKNEGLLTVGSLGGRSNVFTGSVATTPVGWTERAVEVVATGLTGGHSGTEIHLPRGNGVVWAAELLKAARAVAPALRLSTMAVGDALNKIPASGKVVIVGPMSAPFSEVRAAVEKRFKELCDASGEKNAVMTAQQVKKPETAMTVEATEQLTSAILATPNGVIHRADPNGPELPNGVRTSSNLARFLLADGKLELGVMSRSFDGPELQATARRIADSLSRGFAASPQLTSSGYDPWLEDTRGALVTRVLNEARIDGKPAFTRVGFGNFGIETNIWRGIFPSLPMLAIGADTDGEHSSREQVSLASIAMTAKRLDALLQVLASP
ncbi:MAG: hypothetical protein ACAI38_02525 [Myxococcota bacterium]|nr:hypothetical protein [Myxococcota bacterium]